MGWRDTQRRKRKRLTEEHRIAAHLRTSWASASPQVRVDFLAYLEERASTPGAAQLFRAVREREPVEPWPPMPTHEPEPEVPAYNAAVAARGGDPLARALLSPTQLVHTYDPEGGR